MTDNELIRGIRENSAAVWRELYWANYSKIRAIVEPMLRFTRDKTFDDVYTEALMALMENVKDGKLTESDSTNLSGYIYTLCRRTVRRLEDRGRTAEEKMKQMKEEVEAEAKESGGEPFAQDDEDDGIVSPEEYEAAMAFLEEFRLEGEGELSIAAMKEKKKKGWKKQ